METVRTAHYDRPLDADIQCPEQLQIPGIPFIESIFLNLFENVVRHTPENRRPRVKVRTTPEGQTVRMTFAGGPPLNNEEEARVFDKYAFGGESTGTGLGLTLVQEIVQSQMFRNK